MNIKLANGQEINLNDLDKLENKSVDGFGKNFDSEKAGGKKNNIFDKSEIEKIKQFLMEAAGADGVIDENDIQQISLKYKSIFEGFNENTFASDLYSFSKTVADNAKALDKEKQKAGAKEQSNSSTKYKVEAGDTLDKIATKLGYTGKDKEKYVKALEQQLEKDGSFMNDKKWLRAGSSIRLLDKTQLNDLGLKEPVKPNAQATRANSGNAANDKTSPRYKVKAGDTLDKIATKLGYTGKDKQIYIRALEQQLEEDGSFMNNKKWLMAGSSIRLINKEKLTKLGLKEPTNGNQPPAPTPTNNSGSKPVKANNQPPQNAGNSQQKKAVTTPVPETPTPPKKIKTIDANDDKGGLLGTQEKPEAQKVVVLENTFEKITERIKNQGHSAKKVSYNDLNARQKTQYTRLKSIYRVEPEMVKDETTGEVHIFLDTKNSPNGKGSELLSIERIIGASDEIKTYRYHKKGKIALDHEFSDSNKDYSELIQAPTKGNKTSKKIKTAVPIKIKVDPSIYEGASAAQKKEIDAYIKALETKKESLMKDLNLDDDEYNRLAMLALCVAKQESDFGKGTRYNYWDDTKAGIGLKDSIAVINSGLGKIGIQSGSTAVSKGMTQIKIGDWDDDPRIEKLFKKHGITRGYYNSLNGEQSAAATMIVLSEVAKQAKKQQYQDGAEAARGKFFHTTQHLENGKAVDQSKLLYNDVTEDDIMMYIYNGSAGRVKKGTMTPKTRVYTHNIRRFKDLFKIEEDPAKRAEAEKKAVTVSESNSNAEKMQENLGWGIGHVAFMPKLYTKGITTNTDEEIKKLENAMNAKGFDPTLCKKLITKLKNKELSFAYGLTENEIKSLTMNDIKMLLDYSDKLSQKISSAKTPEAKRKIAMEEERAFKYEYLSSHAKQVYYSKVADQSIKLNDDANKNVKTTPAGGYQTGAQTRCNKYLKQLRGNSVADSGLWAYNERVKQGLYTGFCVEKDKGINYNNTSDINILLAQNGVDAANTLRTSGNCLTGAKQALIGSGAVKPEEVQNFNQAYQLAKFLEKHPEKFKEIKYVQISPTVSREITSADIAHLPAGCIVVYGNKARTDVQGHAGVTTGNGQITADEIDNANWDNFAAKTNNQNGKGEHGYFRVFVLNPDYFKLDDENKFLVKK